MIKRLFLLAALTGVWSVSAQNGTLHLRLVDRVTREPVVGAVAELRSQADTARTPFYAASDIDGAALLQRVPAGAWRLRVTSLGYEALERELRTSGGKTDLGTLEMSPGAEAIESVVLEVPALRSSIRGDTLSYRASAYKVTFGADAGLTLGSNISESVDFKIGYTGYYNVSRNSSQIRTVDNVYVSQYLTADLNFVVRQRIVLRGSADYNYYKGITDTFREERLICNLQVGCKLFRRRLGEVTVGVNDLFDQNGTTFRRTVTGTYIRNVSNLGLGRYFLAQFSYNLRLFPRQGAAVTRILQQGVE